MKKRQFAHTLVALLFLANAPLSAGSAPQQRSVQHHQQGNDHRLLKARGATLETATAVDNGNVELPLSASAFRNSNHNRHEGAGVGVPAAAAWQKTPNNGKEDIEKEDGGSSSSSRKSRNGLRNEKNRDVRALATLAPADENNNLAVRAPPSALQQPAAAKSSGGLYSQLPARSLQDWAVEDVILMATVDGTLYARDRKTGEHRWSLQSRPMVETTYTTRTNRSEEGKQASDDAHHDVTNQIYWIVEPTQDGSLYLFSPTNPLGTQKLGLTVKQLVEDLSPHASDDPPVVYTGEKRNHLYTVDIATGNILKSFSPSGSLVSEENVCRPVGSLDNPSTSECGAFGTINLGRTEYIVAIQNRATGEPICTIKYFEWGPNNRDRDLYNQYTSSKDNSHVYSLHNGKILAVDNVYNPDELSDFSQRAMYTQKFASPVVQVFDVARYIHTSSLDQSLIILPQPHIGNHHSKGPAVFDAEDRVFINCTEAGSWYALSENSFPLVTREAIPAQFSQQNWLAYLHQADHLEEWQVEEALVGIHDLSYPQAPPLGVPLIGGPEEIETIESPKDLRPDSFVEPLSRSASDPVRFFVCLVVIALTIAGFRIRNVSKTVVPQASLEKSNEYVQDLATVASQSNTTTESGSAKVETTTEIDIADSNEPGQVETVKIDTEPTPLVERERLSFQKEDAKIIPLESKTNDENTLRDEAQVEEEKGTVIKEEISNDLDMKKDADGIEEDHIGKEALELAKDDSNSSLSKNEEDVPIEQETPKFKKKAHRGKRGGKREAKKREAHANGKEHVDIAESLAKGVDQARQEVVIVKPDAVNQTTTNGHHRQDSTSGLRGLAIKTDRVLGNGSGGTFVFEGEFEGRQVAVKRMLPQFFELASQEVALLEQNDDHPNVIRYFCRREDEHFLYIALELCQASLWDLFRDGRGEGASDPKYSQLITDISREPIKVLSQLTEGVRHLHNFRIVHRDIKPQNMLIAYPKKSSLGSFPRFVISDFGLCKTLPDGGSTLIGATITAGTAGWKAPELISQPRDVISNGSSAGGAPREGDAMAAALGVKRAVDIFSLGCVFFYVLTGGLHPFDDDEGWMAIRERNIKENRCNLAAIEIHGQDTVDLIKWMLSPNPEDRPTATEVLAHPFFWSARDRLEFLSLASDRFDMEPRDGTSPALTELESHAEEIIGLPPKPPTPAGSTLSNGPLWSKIHQRSGSKDNAGATASAASNVTLPPLSAPEPNFLSQLDKKFTDTLGKQRKYNGSRLVDLLRALRNKHHHWDDMPDDVKQRVGEVPEGYLQYWEKRFPKLVVGVWRTVRGLGMGEERRFWRWFGEKGG